MHGEKVWPRYYSEADYGAQQEEIYGQNNSLVKHP